MKRTRHTVSVLIDKRIPFVIDAQRGRNAHGSNREQDKNPKWNIGFHDRRCFVVGCIQESALKEINTI